MYLNKKKFWLEVLINGGFALWFGSLSFLYTFYLLLEGTGQIRARADITNESAAMLAVFFVLFVLFLKRIWISYMAMRMSRLFENDKDGLFRMEELAKQIKKKQEKVVSAFIRCVGKGLLVNCGIYAVDPSYIILSNGAKTIKKRYSAIKCPSCGATNVNRIGFENSCKYCGSTMTL